MFEDTRTSWPSLPAQAGLIFFNEASEIFSQIICSRDFCHRHRFGIATFFEDPVFFSGRSFKKQEDEVKRIVLLREANNKNSLNFEKKFCC